MNLIYKFDNEYSCDIERNIVYDPKGFRIADLTDIMKIFCFDSKKMSDTEIWTLCKPIILAHEFGIKQAKEMITKKILNHFGLKEGEY